MEFIKKNQKMLLCILAAVLVIYFVLPKLTEKFTSSPNKKKLVFNLVSWCGHCTNLKNSGEIEKLKQDHPEIEVEVNNDDDASNKKMGCQGFPCINLADGLTGSPIKQYRGPRTAEHFANFCKSAN